jgi:hypothetical protein
MLTGGMKAWFANEEMVVGAGVGLDINHAAGSDR